MIRQLHSLYRILNCNAQVIGALGLASVVAYNLYQWRRDRALAERLRSERTELPHLNNTPQVSALVAAWNEGGRIDTHIRSFLALRYPQIELILCAGGSDDTLERARHYASDRVIVLEQHPGEGKQRALAKCYEHATGDIIYLTDADCLFDNEALVRLLAPIINEDEQVTTGGSRPLDLQSGRLLPEYIWASDVVSQSLMPHYVEGLLGRNTALTRDVLICIGGLDFSAPTGTDYQLAKRVVRAGLAVRHVSESVVASAYPTQLGEYRRKQSRWLRNLLIYGPRYGSKGDMLRTVSTIGLGMLMVLLPVLALSLGSSVLMLWALLVLHAWISKLRYVLFVAKLYRRPVPLSLLASLLPLTLADFAIWASPIVDLLFSQRRHRW